MACSPRVFLSASATPPPPSAAASSSSPFLSTGHVSSAPSTSRQAFLSYGVPIDPRLPSCSCSWPPISISFFFRCIIHGSKVKVLRDATFVCPVSWGDCCGG